MHGIRMVIQNHTENRIVALWVNCFCMDLEQFSYDM
jgi:hypothetical protein